MRKNYLLLFMCMALNVQGQIQIGQKMVSLSLGLSNKNTTVSVNSGSDPEEARTNDKVLDLSFKGGYVLYPNLMVGGSAGFYAFSSKKVGEEINDKVNAGKLGAFTRLYAPLRSRILPWTQLGVNYIYGVEKQLIDTNVGSTDYHTTKVSLIRPNIAFGISFFNKEMNRALELEISMERLGSRKDYEGMQNWLRVIKMGYQLYF